MGERLARLDTSSLRCRRVASGLGRSLIFPRKAVIPLLSTSQTSSLTQEVGHADRGQARGGMMPSCVVVDLVDRDGGVDDRRLDRFCRSEQRAFPSGPGWARGKLTSLDNGLHDLVDAG